MGVRCSACGFLSLRNHETNALDEANEQYRQSGISNRSLHLEEPICFKAAFPLAEEAKAAGTTADDAARRLKVITSDRPTCQKFTPWKPGFTPKEHQQMLDSETLLKHLQEQRKSDRIWQFVLAVFNLILGFILGRLGK
jgi:hypothetical protein